jgi:hypothetical protein
MDATHNGLAATSIPFTQLSTMLIHHHAHTTFPGHHHLGDWHGMHYPIAFISVVKATFDARYSLHVPTTRTAASAHHHIVAIALKPALPMADKLHWHQDCPLPLQPSLHVDRKPRHHQYQQEQ